jgi:hypothetical protein
MIYKISEHSHARRCMLLIILAFTILPAHAQKKGYSAGYIIDADGETVEGWVKDRSSGPFLELYTRIRFKPNNNSLRRKYSPDEIQGYGTGDQNFESVPLAEESAFFKFRYYLDESSARVFLKVISRSECLTYYHWEYVDEESSYLDYIPLLYRTGSGEMVRVTQGILGLKRNRLMDYFRDCPELVHAIENKELNETGEVFNFYTEHCAGSGIKP